MKTFMKLQMHEGRKTRKLEQSLNTNHVKVLNH